MKVEEKAGLDYLVSEANSLKVKAGLGFKAVIKDLLNQLRDAGVIRGFKSNVNFTHESYAYSDQYKADYLIETVDSKVIVVRSSNSFRSCRVKMGFYDLDGISKHGSIGQDVIASIYLVSDNDIGNAPFDAARKMFEDGDYYCPATHLFYLYEFVDFLNEYKHSFEIRRKEEREELEQQEIFGSELYADLESGIVTGSDFGKAGNKLELTITDLLSKTNELRILKDDSENCDPVFREIVETICFNEGIELQNILSIQGTNRIIMLKSSGSPKTDVKLNLQLKDGKALIVTLSIKNTIATRVTCHDYKAEAFIRVLDCENTKLADYIRLFQKYPTHTSFQRNMPEGMSLDEFVRLLSEKATVLSEWATMGKHDSLNLIDPETQVSKYLFINNWKTGQYAFYLYSDYLELISTKRKGKFGVPFGWTYPSGSEGVRIQLKLPIIL